MARQLVSRWATLACPMNVWVSGSAQAAQLAELTSCPWPGSVMSRLSGKSACAPAQFRGWSFGSAAPLNASTGTVDIVSCCWPTAAADLGISGQMNCMNRADSRSVW